ncbi:MAG: zinc ABC transporter substrate-binding protein [Solirubrobacteraceae bacterium]|nr:zinc ABC transporter substrate-binding protein [Patulibacter sp.]
MASPARRVPSSRRTPFLVAAAVAVFAAVGVAGCGSDGGSSGASAAGTLDVVATTTQLGDIVREVGGSAVDVHQILQPNSDPHDYEPRPADVAAVAKAKVVFESGNTLDAWMGKVVSAAGGDAKVVTAADTNVDRVAGEKSGPEASTYDPHWWHDPKNVEAVIPEIRDALIAADPGKEAAFTAAASAYLRKVQALDGRLARCLSSIPASERKLVTSHDAFNYFAKRYGITVIGAVIPSQTTQAQPSAGALASLAALVRKEHVKAVFPESSINPKLADALAKETGATAKLELYGDTLGPVDSPAGTYIGMEQANGEAMMRGFTGGKQGCPA